MTTILLAEDEERISAFVQRGLSQAGFDVEIVDDGEVALERALSGGYNLLILDVGLPGMDGFLILQALRRHNCTLPVIMLTARTSTPDTVKGLDSGANDYIAKPFVFAELLARVQLRLRENTSPEVTTSITHGTISLDLRTHRITVAGKEIELSAREFALAETFMRNPGKPLSKEELLREVWDMDFDPSTNVVEVYIRYLRAKIGSARIKTVRGKGYRWE